MKVHNLEIINADCMEVMKTYKDNEFDLAVVDPPYGIDAGKSFAGGIRKKYKGTTNTEKEWDSKIPSDSYFKELKRVSKNQIIWGGNYFPYLWKKGCKGFIFWHKGNPAPTFADGELAYTSFNKVARMVDLRYYGNLEDGTSASGKIHPTQKPVKLYEWIYMNYAEEGQKILDTHLGSGTNAIAAHYADLSFTGIEIDKDYYKASCTKIKAKTQQTTLF